ncbi:DNA-directed RNA polymerase [Candidatus Woesearchaeota archaeon CG10_big_fil_rev_8_21_14_0_10_37_12]|nr:MAG: DNA-directed RNA polymerase [Candidatus Woesearchaeota archaeon CG10_big_fil_rev_8_21_14_0_10_37_12]
MFYKIEVQDHVRVAPRLFGNNVQDAVIKAVKQKYDGIIDPNLGVVIDVATVKNVGEGVIIPGDGASYYDTIFELLTFQPEIQELLPGKIKDIADFGAFITLGPIDGMIHISQTMDDFVTFAKDKTLAGRDSKRALKVGDTCRARVIAVSFKDITNPKIGLTMRQPGLGKLEWVEQEGKDKIVEKTEEKPKTNKEKK